MNRQNSVNENQEVKQQTVSDRLDMEYKEEGKKVFSEMAAPSPSCLKCNKFLVCQIFRVFSQFIGQNGYNEIVKVDDMAKICNLYELDQKFLTSLKEPIQ